VQAFSEYLAATEKSKHTIRNYHHDLHQFRLWYEHRESNDRPLAAVGQVNAVQCREWKAWMLAPTFSLHPGKEAKRASTATVNRRLAAMHSFLEWAFHTRRLERQVERPKALRQKRLGHRGLERRDERDLLSSAEDASPRDRAVVHCLLYSGLRVAEFAGLLWSDLHLVGRDRQMVVRGKGAKTRTVPIHPKTMAALEVLGLAEHRGTDRRIVHGQRGPLNTRAIQAIVQQFGINAHKLRHTFAHNFLKGGGSLDQLADILGHEDLETTRRYVASSAGDLQTAMDRMGGSD
jgi:site-specific recombinase XerD